MLINQQESSIISHRSLSNHQKKTVADKIYEIVEMYCCINAGGISMAEIQEEFFNIHDYRIEKSTISPRVNELITSGRLFRHPHLRTCTITGKAIHPITLSKGQLNLL